jgi:polar amino acid transport system substrate-binding protein
MVNTTRHDSSESQKSRTRTRPRRTLATAVAFVLGLAVFTACGAEESSKATPGGDAPAGSARALLPDDVAKQGYMTAVSNMAFPPYGFLNGSDFKGIEPELAEAIGERLGVDVKWEKVEFAGVIPGLQAGRYDFGLTAITDTAERQAAVDFLDYFQKSNVLVVRDDNPKGINTLDDVCGLSAASQKGSNYQELFLDQSKKCRSEGKKAIDLHLYPAVPDFLFAVQSGRDPVAIIERTSGQYALDNSTQGLKLLTEETYQPAFYGMAFPKNSKLLPAVRAAFLEVIEDGTYAKILDKWKASDGLYTEATVNEKPVD